jgi:nucleoid DNA-binding protein
MASKPAKSRPVTIRDLGNQLAEDHELSKKQGQEMLHDLVSLITKHLKKGERVNIVGLGILQVASAPPAWAATRRPAKRSRSRPAGKSRSARPRI